ncbi:10280_t:CDS:2, partial [Racocetra persica]
GYALYKCYIYPLYLSPLRKIPGPPVDNFIVGHYASFLNKELGEALAYLAKQYGDSHKRQRKMMNPLYTFANIKEMVPIFVQAGHKLKDIWMVQIGNKKEERITITALIPKTTLDVIGLVGFNYEFNSTTSESKLAQAYNSIVSCSPSPLYIALLVAEQKNSPVHGKDLLSLLVKANEKLPANEQLTHNELVNQVMTLLVAGHETTSVALSWALYFLAKHLDIQDRLRKEVLDIFTDRNYFPAFDDIEHVKFLDCVFKETLRVVPP